MTFVLALLALCVLAPLVLHIVSLAVVGMRLRAEPASVAARGSGECISVVRPVNGLEFDVERCLESSFLLDDPSFELIFCAQADADPVIPLLRQLMARYPSVPARLLCGDDRISANPKLNNMAKGWDAAKGGWVLFSDGNTILPPCHLARHMAAWTPNAGVVTTVFIGERPESFWAEVECAFLNQYQARWWYFAACVLPSSFCHGKSMLVRRDQLEAAGGMPSLTQKLAEDIALAALVRAGGSDIVAVWRPVAQPLGPRSASTVIDRQTRWARLRRLSYPDAFALEILSGPLLPIAAGAALASILGGSGSAAMLALAGIWYGSELAFAKATRFHVSRWSLPASVLRDAAIPAIWLYALVGRNFRWSGKAVYRI